MADQPVPEYDLTKSAPDDAERAKVMLHHDSTWLRQRLDNQYHTDRYTVLARSEIEDMTPTQVKAWASFAEAISPGRVGVFVTADEIRQVRPEADRIESALNAEWWNCKWAAEREAREAAKEEASA